MSNETPNRSDAVIEGFGEEWGHYDQASLSDRERRKIFDDYFHIFPWDDLPAGAVCADIGCGSGRWAMVAAPRVGQLHCVEPSQALAVARRNLGAAANVQFHQAGVDDLPFEDASLDAAYCLGVLHHVPDPQAGLQAIARKLKPGAPFLVYLYYAFDNRPWHYRALWRASDMVRRALSRWPFFLRLAASKVIAATVYWPLARTGRLLAGLGRLPANWPLAYYRDKSFYTMCTNALDRFGTRLEQRFTRDDIRRMLGRAGFGEVHFSDRAPYWSAITHKR
ncbi:MAG TPA: SAM-dependent methyltransferase [Rhodospirillaceae bacterium]|nr:SAM-dependent methyltransferase [Rhodospirillaceae bacterium]